MDVKGYREERVRKVGADNGWRLEQVLVIRKYHTNAEMGSGKEKKIKAT